MHPTQCGRKSSTGVQRPSIVVVLDVRLAYRNELVDEHAVSLHFFGIVVDGGEHDAKVTQQLSLLVRCLPRREHEPLVHPRVVGVQAAGVVRVGANNRIGCVVPIFALAWFVSLLELVLRVLQIVDDNGDEKVEQNKSAEDYERDEVHNNVCRVAPLSPLGVVAVHEEPIVHRHQLKQRQEREGKRSKALRVDVGVQRAPYHGPHIRDESDECDDGAHGRNRLDERRDDDLEAPQELDRTQHTECAYGAYGPENSQKSENFRVECRHSDGKWKDEVENARQHDEAVEAVPRGGKVELSECENFDEHFKEVNAEEDAVNDLKKVPCIASDAARGL
eukprot:Opistho-1_new@2881